MPLVDVLAGMPNYGKFLKELISNKHKIEQIYAAFLSDESSAMIQNKVPPKLRDPRSFLIPCNFNKTFSCNALADLGASINLMPYSLYVKLSHETLKPTKTSVRLVDRSFQYPVGIAKNMLVEVGKLTFSADFVILEMKEDSKKQLNLGVGTERMIFNIDYAIKHSYSKDDTCFSIDVIDEIFEEDFDALLDEGSKILHSIEGTVLEEEIFFEFDKFIAMTTDEIYDSESNTEEPPFEKIIINKDYKIKTSVKEPLLGILYNIINSVSIIVSSASIIKMRATLQENKSSPLDPKTAKQLLIIEGIKKGLIASCILSNNLMSTSIKFHMYSEAKSIGAWLIRKSRFGVDLIKIHQLQGVLHERANSFLAQPTTSPQLENEDFQHMDGDDLEELDLRWQVAMLTVRVKKSFRGQEEIWTSRKNDLSGRSQGRRPYGDRSNAQTTESSSQALVAQDGNPLTSRADISFTRLDEYAFRNKIIESKTTETNKTIGTTNEATIVKPKSVNETIVSKSKINRDETIIEDWTSDDEDDMCAVKTVSSVKPNVTQAIRSQADKSGQTSQKQGI
ncbi:reverse transcriptase domain-containing protein [Tanacetum coccineum]